jgi:uncharacterized membrane protein
MNIEDLISLILRIGVLISALLIILGLIISYYYNHSLRPLELSSSSPLLPENLGALIISYGLITLISTPIIRVFILFLKYYHAKSALAAIPNALL